MQDQEGWKQLMRPVQNQPQSYSKNPKSGFQQDLLWKLCILYRQIEF